MMINTNLIKRFYRRLSHEAYGITELVVVDPRGGIIATGFFNDERAFLSACMQHNGHYNIYAGRNPRPRRFVSSNRINRLDHWAHKRAKDSDIRHVTAISLDIDPVRPKSTSSTSRQMANAVEFAVKVREETGGWVDCSGNGAYLWIPFAEPIVVSDANRARVKAQCRAWQYALVERFGPARHGLRVDGCYDLSRVKKVIGTLSVKGTVHRLSRFVVRGGPPDNRIRDEILSMAVAKLERKVVGSGLAPSSRVPDAFLVQLQTNPAIRQLWLAPDNEGDTSRHDWELGCESLRAGIRTEADLVRILAANPFGKYQRDRRTGYVKHTVRKLLEQK